MQKFHVEKSKMLNNVRISITDSSICLWLWYDSAWCCSASDNKQVNRKKNVCVRILADKELGGGGGGVSPDKENIICKGPEVESASNSPELGRGWLLLDYDGQWSGPIMQGWVAQERTWGCILSAVGNHRKVLSREVTFVCF